MSLVRPEADWKIAYLGKKQYLFTLKDEYVLMTGSPVNLDFGIIKAHRLIKVELKHTNSAKTESIDALDITFQRKMEKLGSLLHDLFEESGIIKSDIRLLFGEKYEYLSQYYRLTLDTTETDRIYLEVYVQLMG